MVRIIPRDVPTAAAIQAEEARQEKLQREMDSMRIRTLFQMVDELRVVSGGRSVTQRVVWLNNKQANMFNPKSMRRLLNALEVKVPPNVIIFIRGGMYTKAMYANAGRPYMTRVKDCKYSHITMSDGKRPNPENAGEAIKPGDIVTVEEEGQVLQGQVLELLSSSAYIVFENEIIPLQLIKNIVAPTKAEVNDLERRISLFITQSLMPMVKKTGGLVVCDGINDCSLCSAIGKAFADISTAGSGTNGPGPSPPGGSSSGGLGGGGQDGDQSTQNKGRIPSSQQGVGRPRLLCIVRTPMVAAAMLRPGTNAYNLRRAANEKASSYSSPLNFLSEEYMETFLPNSNGFDHDAWCQCTLTA